MSKSIGGTGTVWVLDDPKTITKKVKSAVTDTGREVRAADDKPGITNLLTVLSVCTGRTVAELEQQYEGKGYGDFKADVAQAVVELTEPVRQRYAELVADHAHLDAVLARGAERAGSVAEQTDGRRARAHRPARAGALRPAACPAATSASPSACPSPTRASSPTGAPGSATRTPPASRRTSPCCPRPRCTTRSCPRSRSTCAWWPRARAPFEVHLRGSATFRPVSPVVFVPLVRGISECERVEAQVRSGPLRASSGSRTTRT
jgi:hypothetical protein